LERRRISAQGEGSMTSNRLGIKIKDLKLLGDKLVVEEKRYDKCTELKRKYSKKTRPAKRGEVSNV
jgi:hypothetical protein